MPTGGVESWSSQIGRSSRRASLTALLLVATFSSGCAASQPLILPAEDRAVVIETEACGAASGRVGSGVAVGNDLVVTVAHLIVRAGGLSATPTGGQPQAAEVVAVDLRRDLAVVRLDGLALPEVDIATSGPGGTGRIVEAARSGTVPFEIATFADLRIEEILGSERHTRQGYELVAVTTDGDSGAGAYDEEGRLIGIVFGRGPADDTTWVTASTEIFDFLETVDSEDTHELCG